MTSIRTSALVLIGLTAAAQAQPIETITFSITWDYATIIHGGTNTGAVWAHITPDIGTTTAWNTKPGSGQSGILKAFASSVIDLVSVQNGIEGTLGWTVPAEFNIATMPGTSDGQGGISKSHAGQFGFPINTNPNVGQKVKVLDLEWKDAGSLNGYVIYGTQASSGKVFLDAGNPNWVGENVALVDGQGSFGVGLPAPASLALLALGGLVASRRRRWRFDGVNLSNGGTSPAPPRPRRAPRRAATSGSTTAS